MLLRRLTLLSMCDLPALKSARPEDLADHQSHLVSACIVKSSPSTARSSCNIDLDFGNSHDLANRIAYIWFNKALGSCKYPPGCQKIIRVARVKSPA